MATSTRSVTNKTKMLEAWYNTVHICWEDTLGRGDLKWSLIYAENIIPGFVEADPFTYWLLPGHWMKVFKLRFGVQLLLQPLDQGLWPSLIGRVVSHCRSFSPLFFFSSPHAIILRDKGGKLCGFCGLCYKAQELKLTGLRRWFENAKSATCLTFFFTPHPQSPAFSNRLTVVAG